MSRNFELMNQIEGEFGTGQNSIRSVADAADVKTAVPYSAAVIGGDDMSRLVQSVFFSSGGSAPRQVVFCGVDAKNGSSSVCARVGRILAAAKWGSVCLVDANLRSKLLSNRFGVAKTAASSRPSAAVQEKCIQIGDNLWLAGRDVLADDGGALPSEATLKHLLSELRGAFTYSLIDAPGLGVSGDAAMLGQVADGTVMVIEADTTRKIAARKAKEALDAARVRVLGSVLHNRSFPIPERLYGKL
jgi:Mrp family chromosome partitioning ATPase